MIRTFPPGLSRTGADIMRHIATLLAAAVLAAGVVPAFAQKVATRAEPDDSDLVRLLVEKAPDPDEKLVGRIEVTELLEEEDEDFEFEIKPGKTYWIYGACDLECGDIDLKAEDEDGHELDADDEGDDAPILIFTAKNSHELHVTLSMAACGETSCHAGFGVYEQP
jgi:hypothetical protein